MLFLFVRLMNKSNRGVEKLLYKEVKFVLQNSLSFCLEGEMSGEFAGDGSGYSLTITKHYRSNLQRRKERISDTFFQDN